MTRTSWTSGFSVLAVLMALMHLTVVDSRCPNACSGHGTCGQNNVCTCFSGWTGGAADCSTRTCPEGPAWADKAYATDKAHLDAECSNAGHCNRATGQCECFEGFTGSACQRAKCPNDCNGHGTCVTIADVAFFYGTDYDQTDSIATGDGVGITYNNWDKDSITMCECDGGFFGADCSLHMCPKGDDPLTINQNYKKINLNLAIASGSFAGDIGFQFMGVTTFIDLDAPTDLQCKQALESNTHIGSVRCIVTATDSTHYDLEVTFYTWPTLSRANNLFYHDGNPPATDFFCDTSQVTGDAITCTFTDVERLNVREYAYCSNRGTCDFSTGMCDCNTGYGGGACSNTTYFAGTGANAQPGFQVLVDGLDYQGDALQIRSAKQKASDFYLIEAIADTERMFFVRGDGAVGVNSLVVPGGATIAAGGLKVAAGGATIDTLGLTISDDGLLVSSDLSAASQTYVARMSMTNSGVVDEHDATLELTTATTTLHNHLEASDSSGNTVFELLTTGQTKISAGGLLVTDGVSINNAGLTVTGGVSVRDGGVYVTGGLTVGSGAITAGQGLHLTGGGLQIDSGGFKVNAAGGDVVSGGLRVHSGVTDLKAGLHITGGLTMYQGGLQMTGGATINNNGLKVTGGVTVYDGGMSVVSGGLQVTGGLTVFGATGFTLDSTTFTGSSNAAYSDGGSQYVLTTSDRRLKRNLLKVDSTTSSVERVCQLQGVYYHWIPAVLEEKGYEDRRHIGFIAQDVMDVIPEAVHEIDSDHHLAIDYSQVVPVLADAIKELSGTQQDLTDTLGEIKAQLVAMENRMRDLETKEKE